jgi:Staphylococcal nuclease homologue
MSAHERSALAPALSIFKTLIAPGAALFAVAALAASDPVLPSLPAAQCMLETAKSLSVLGIRDSENVILEGGQELSLGVHTADLDDSRTKQALENLLKDRTITIYRAHPGARTYQDRYGRIRGHAVVRTSTTNIWLQGYLVSRGLAQVAIEGAAGICASRLLEIEEEARQNQRGYWSSGVFQVFDADETAAISAQLGRFAIVEGRIRRISKSGDRIYLNMGKSWRDDFTVRVPAWLANVNLESGALTFRRTAAVVSPASLKSGSRIRVRGWIEQRGGPLIEIHRPEQIERR